LKNKANTIGLHDLLEGFLFSLKAEGKSSRTINYYQDLLLPFLNYVSSKNWSENLNQIDTQKIREFLNWTGSRNWEYNVGNGTIRNLQAKPSTAWPYFRALRRLFNWAIEEGYIESSPLKSIHFKQPKAPPVEGYTRDELQRLLAVCDLDIKNRSRFTGIRNKAMLLVFIDSGIRRSEQNQLRITDIDLDNRRLRVMGKGGKTGIAPFSAKTAKALWAWLIQRKTRANTDRLWVTEEGNPFSVDGLVSWFARLKKRAGVNGPGGIHRLRHTAALEYLRGARDSFKLQLFLRHSSLEMSRRYTQGLQQEEVFEAHRNGASPVERLGLG
jgi:site-specific recombinase XerD